MLVLSSVKGNVVCLHENIRSGESSPRHFRSVLLDEQTTCYVLRIGLPCAVMVLVGCAAFLSNSSWIGVQNGIAQSRRHGPVGCSVGGR